ncbi:hypothetical protein D051_4695 [Vibrio parahaemolyticus VPCR-2010]|nr:hypothetical protein D051_4695 [Vibrio parahaemolyticus VPCR-2010]
MKTGLFLIYSSYPSLPLQVRQMTWIFRLFVQKNTGNETYFPLINKNKT